MSSFIKIKNKKGWLKMNLVHSCQLVKSCDNTTIKIKIDNDMLPYLIGVSWHFSAPKLENFKHFKKDQHFKLYSFFYSHLFKGSTPDISIKALRDILDIKKSQYQKIGHLKSRLLTPSITLINQVTDIHISAIEIKHERKIIAFKFQLSKQSSSKLLMTAKSIKKTTVTKTKANPSVKALWLSTQDYEWIVKNHGADYAQQLLKYVNYQSQKLAIKSPKNYLFGILKNKPKLNGLLTPSDHSHRVKKKQQQLEQQTQIAVEREKLQNKVEAAKIKSAVDQFMANSNPAKINIMKEQFNASIFSQWIKFGADQVDFNKPVVKACFNHYLWQHCL